MSPNKTFIDLNYSFESTLLKTAQQAGAKVIDGRELLLQQGLEAFKNLTDHEPPEKILEVVFLQIKSLENLIYHDEMRHYFF